MSNWYLWLKAFDKARADGHKRHSIEVADTTVAQAVTIGAVTRGAERKGSA